MGIDTSSLFFVDNCQIIDAAVRNHFGTGEDIYFHGTTYQEGNAEFLFYLCSK
jgi:hypothetical protein